ncbi:unnamed protein product [Lepeophtheirus salmonis]|uniref:(salmon louse) hypothetical protein n=1 Tax=Lepeophtheirus salmonis TaxID=72036 RepID=A0A7R8H2U1_LEPSM|nr:unnamed protein product [Lepeophtheirus salmonis]CAF2834106.1 unnamed protein product [Lepeophtheirus salmonis]
MFRIKPHSQTEIGRKYPVACKSITSNLYVDDVCEESRDSEYARSLVNEFKNFFSSEGWNLTKFASNSSELLDFLSTEDHLIKSFVELRYASLDGTTMGLGIG